MAPMGFGRAEPATTSGGGDTTSRRLLQTLTTDAAGIPIIPTSSFDLTIPACNSKWKAVKQICGTLLKAGSHNPNNAALSTQADASHFQEVYTKQQTGGLNACVFPSRMLIRFLLAFLIDLKKCHCEGHGPCIVDTGTDVPSIVPASSLGYRA